MEPGAAIDIYCERLGPGFWAEPWNLATNLAFLVAAWVMARRLAGADLIWAQGLVALLVAIGLGSALFHGFATAWAAVADVLPIALFILVYVFVLHRHLLCWPLWLAMASLPIFVIFAALTGAALTNVTFFSVSAGYWPIVLALGIYAVATYRNRPALGRGLAFGTTLLTLSLTARSLDQLACPLLPIGTHFTWHLLNAWMLGWMIELYRQQMLATRARRG